MIIMIMLIIGLRLLIVERCAVQADRGTACPASEPSDSLFGTAAGDCDSCKVYMGILL